METGIGIGNEVGWTGSRHRPIAITYIAQAPGIFGARKFGRKFWAQGNLGASRNLGESGNLGAESEFWAQD